MLSLFVNPRQFGPGEDFERYPRDEERDLRLAKAAGCDALFLPSVEEIYPLGSKTSVSIAGLSAPLCGAQRPGHFSGVVTVVLKLLNISGCQLAIFGQKDYQQLALIQQMVRDLNLEVEILAAPTVRERDGLAMSSRNRYLSPQERLEARSLNFALEAAAQAWAEGLRDPRLIEALAEAQLSEEGVLEYLELRDASSLEALVGPVERPAVLALALRFGETRLIDNRLLEP